MRVFGKSRHAAYVALSALLVLPGLAGARALPYSSDIDVAVLSMRGVQLPTYPVDDGLRGATWRGYVEARPQERYQILVRNRSPSRIGVVIAVDGRNIISGQRSWLSPDERMYVLGPYQSATYDGWRTGRDRVNAFYFTDEGASYAAAFDDHTAMGVVAVAAFREREREPYRGYPERDSRESGKGSSRAAPAEKSDRSAEPGTGFGEERYSPSVRVAFEPERRPLARVFLKYEWRETLCALGVTYCGGRPNRFWPETPSDTLGYAPYPPGHPQRGWRGYGD